MSSKENIDEIIKYRPEVKQDANRLVSAYHWCESHPLAVIGTVMLGGWLYNRMLYATNRKINLPDRLNRMENRVDEVNDRLKNLERTMYNGKDGIIERSELIKRFDALMRSINKQQKHIATLAA
jgi:hypothetical protein